MPIITLSHRLSDEKLLLTSWKNKGVRNHYLSLAMFVVEPLSLRLLSSNLSLQGVSILSGFCSVLEPFIPSHRGRLHGVWNFCCGGE